MRRSLHPALVGLAGALVVAALAGLWAVRQPRLLAPVERLERYLLDLRFQLRGARPPGPEVVVVALDDRSAEEDQALLERRAGMARLLRALRAAGVKVIGVDIFWPQAEQPIDPLLAKDVLAYLERCAAGCPDGEALSLLRRLRPELVGDEDLAGALKEAGEVVLAMRASISKGTAAPVVGLAKGRYGQAVDGPTPPDEVDAVDASLPLFNAPARALGFVSTHEDETSAVREVRAARAIGRATYAPFGVHLAAAWLGVPRARVVYDGANRRIVLGERSVPFDPGGGVFLNFRGPEASFPTYSAVDVVQGKVPAGALAGKMALVGYTFMGHDRVRTPFGPQVPGVELNATFVDNLLRGDPLRRAPWFWDVLACLGMGLAVALCFGLLPGVGLKAGAALLAWAGWLGGSFAAFVRADLWLPWLWPSLAFVVALAGALLVAWSREGRQRRELRRAFSHYLAEEVIAELERRDEPLRLGGERRVLTALFSDIRGFTTLSEKLDPLQLVAFLNAHLGAMTGAVLARGGLLDKYIGDALMAFFGAPVPHPDHADRALAAVLAMHRELEALNAGPFAALGLKVAIGVGLNTGEMVVGNMGSATRFNYTVAGDAVNLASRLESLTKAYGVFCLCGDGTRRAAAPGFGFREVDLVQVKGKTEAVAIHELLGGPERTLARYEDLPLFAEAMADWRAGRFAEARGRFAAFAEKNPSDRVAALYLERLAALGDRPPEGWCGVFVHAEK